MELLTLSTWLCKDWVPPVDGCTMAEFCRVIESIGAIASSLPIPVRMQRDSLNALSNGQGREGASLH